ncbi:hypothetical protein TanjilG_04247 [Lupinus angustifolius]|uniref:Enoyl reductase (ER) domain-containing protein n=1 Tax=Lupinus angustifolius TaxID=3871 RepID=A0A4P1RQ26_LUPAN|nr:PREDICTED: 2-alkenal reductase (NADP(+)-dependent)-like [Lupinus angustifolius]OIW15712.1 hypothetical protein TanjilG_04247 [Lupinus angustifolius]
MAEEEKSMVESKEWYLASYAREGVPTSDHLKLRTLHLSLALHSIPHGHVAIQSLFLSIDPYLRSTFTATLDGLCLPQYQLNQVITAFGIGRVKGSKDNKYEEGDIVLIAYSPVAEYFVISSTEIISKVDTESGISLPEYLSSLGVAGFAAWVGIEVVGEAKTGSNVFISAACGAVGIIAGQLAKLKGCRVIGSTGSDQKVRVIKEEFGYDDGFNYNKETDFDAALSKYFPNGIDVYLDNVGGKMLEAVLNHVNKHARIALCGMISDYNKVWREREGPRNLLNMIGKEVRMEGYMVLSYFNRFGDFATEMEGYIKEGKVKSKHQINIGIETFLDCLCSLFSSSNVGKVLVQLHP